MGRMIDVIAIDMVLADDMADLQRREFWTGDREQDIRSDVGGAIGGGRA
jgi:hypothetical protein